MKFDYNIEPETKYEEELIESVAMARNRALEHGVSEDVVSTVLSLFAMRMGSGSPTDQNAPTGSVCPVCGELIEGVSISGIGSVPELVPCGCEVEYDDLPDSVLDDLIQE